MSDKHERGSDFVQLLASALPGFRDLRAPLIAGYLWLVFVWILATPDVEKRPDDQAAAALFDIGRAAGPIWCGIAVSVAAFLVGSVSQSLTPFLNRTLAAVHGGWTKFEEGLWMKGQLSLPRPIARTAARRQAENARDPLYQYYVEAAGKLSHKPNRDKFTGEILDPDREVGQRSLEAERALRREISLPATLLLGKEPELFTEADRLKAEGQLRFAVVPPMVALVGYLAITTTRWWWLCLLAVAILLWQGYKREYDYETLMLGAVELGVIPSKTLEELKKWVADIPGLTPEEQAAEDQRLRQVLAEPPDPELDRWTPTPHY